MKALTLHQPWASLIAVGAKTIETRSWSTAHRGPLAIHAAKLWPPTSPVPEGIGYSSRIVPGVSADDWWTLNGERFLDLRAVPLGAVVATCTLADVVPIIGRDESETSERFVRHVLPDDWGEPGRGTLAFHRAWGEYDDVTGQEPFGDFAPGRFAWLLADVEALPEPIPARGRQGLWEWDEAA